MKGNWCECKPGWIFLEKGVKSYHVSLINKVRCTPAAAGGAGAGVGKVADVLPETVKRLHVHNHHKVGGKVMQKNQYAYTLAGTRRHCGTSWLREEQGIELDVPIVQGWPSAAPLSTSPPFGAGDGNGLPVVENELVVVINNKGKGGLNGCDPHDLSMWLSIEGPESMVRSTHMMNVSCNPRIRTCGRVDLHLTPDMSSRTHAHTHTRMPLPQNAGTGSNTGPVREMFLDGKIHIHPSWQQLQAIDAAAILGWSPRIRLNIMP